MTLPVTDLIVQQLLEFDPNFEVGAGTAISGLMIEPLSIILQPIVDELTVAQASKSILTILESSDPDAFPEDLVDALASNEFVERQPGQIFSDVERLRFFSPQAFSSPRGTLIWRGPAGQRYTNSEAVSVTKSEMTLLQEGSLYFVDIPILALEEGSSFNVAAGSITSMEAEPVGVASMTNRFGSAAGRDRETNTELIDRIKVAVTVRALVTGRGIIVTLTENFTSIVEITPIGFEDPEMMRDIVYNVHIGGNVDVYVKTAAFVSGQKDVFNLRIDTTRRTAGSSTVVASVANQDYALAHQSLDNTSVTPLVKSIDGFAFLGLQDYTLNSATGQIRRLPNATEDPFDPSPSVIFHLEVTGASCTATGDPLRAKRFFKSGAFSDVRAGQILTISTPASLAGAYTIKEIISVDEIEIFGTFPGAIGSFPISSVDAIIDDLLVVEYEYNPISIDIIQTVRDVARTDYTITDVPLIIVDAVEELDPISGETTGVLLSGDGGYGAGGYGEGGYGIGSAPDFVLVVTKPTLRFSDREDNYLAFDSSWLGKAVRVTYRYANAIPAIQAFCDDRDNQTEAASLVVKNYIPVFVDGGTTIDYDIDAADAATAISVDEMTTRVKASINDISASRPLELTDLVDVMYNNGAVRVGLSSLQKLQGSIHHEDGTLEFVSPTAEGVMAIPSDPIPDPTDRPLSPRIARFIANNITLSRSVV